MASLSLCPQLETNFMLNRKVIELLLQLKSAKAHGKNYIKVKSHLVRHLLRDCQFRQRLHETVSVWNRYEISTDKPCIHTGPGGSGTDRICYLVPNGSTYKGDLV